MARTSPSEAYEAALAAYRADSSDSNLSTYHKAEAGLQKARDNERASRPTPRVWDTVNEVWVDPVQPETVFATSGVHQDGVN